MCSCEGIVLGGGKIVSSKDQKPIDSVLVYWTNGKIKTYSDSSGMFKHEMFCGCVPDCPDLELIFYKKGFETKYLNFTKEYGHATDSIIVQLNPTVELDKEIKETGFETFLKYFNVLLSIFNIFTLVIICCVKIKWKPLWIISCIFFSITLKYNYYNNEFDISFFSFFVQLRYLQIYYIGWYLFFIPVTTIAFWLYYFNTKNQTKLSADT